MSDFEDRLKQAIQRGQRRSFAHSQQQKQQRLSEDEARRKHNDLRLQISEHIERVLRALTQQLPGFQYETIYGDRGWGGAISRDDVNIGSSGRRNLFSRLEVAVKPFTEFHVVDLHGKGTIRNKETFARSFFRPADEAQLDQFLETVDQWVLEYAEQFVGQSRDV